VQYFNQFQGIICTLLHIQNLHAPKTSRNK